ncbi:MULTISPECIES: cell division protein FtsQ/DivIB [Amniculibacterium]|uniref:cell division protein FtsQ/DivIB n=1 Tax=Amniculibacterium TaxID=2715289 RepID=UPI001F14D42B|nr:MULTISPECIES: cell division protein FtsQ [Amniculibacterium]
MKNKWRILKILVTVIVLGFLLSFSLKRFAQKPMDNIAVNLKQSPVYFLDEKDIKRIVKKYNPTQKLKDIDIPNLEKKLNSLAAVDSANVYLGLNGKLNIDIKQKVPVFRLHRGDKEIYVDKKGREFPTTFNYTHPCMLVDGDVDPVDYPALSELIHKIDEDPFCKKYFIGISKVGQNYNLLTSEGHFKVEIGDLENIDFKVKGFKTFAEKILIYQDPTKYTKISVKYGNQIVTTLNPRLEENDSILQISKKEFDKIQMDKNNKNIIKPAVVKEKKEEKKTNI